MDILNEILRLVKSVFNWLIGQLPDSPFQALDTAPISNVIGYINFFIDIPFMLHATELWLAAIAVYYIYLAILRWVRAIP